MVSWRRACVAVETESGVCVGGFVCRLSVADPAGGAAAARALQATGPRVPVLSRCVAWVVCVRLVFVELGGRRRLSSLPTRSSSRRPATTYVECLCVRLPIAAANKERLPALPDLSDQSGGLSNPVYYNFIRCVLCCAVSVESLLVL